MLLLQLVLSGVTEDSSLAIAGSTLAVAALFRPARARIQAGGRPPLLPAQVRRSAHARAFSARLRDEVTSARSATELSAVVTETLQPAHVSLWLRVPEANR